CGFPVHIGWPEQNVYATTWFRSDNTVVQHFSGTLVATLRNVRTGASITANVSGPAVDTFPPDGSSDVKLLGPAVIWVVTGPLPSLAITHGQVDLHSDSPFSSLEVTKLTGTAEDVCAELS